jgi:E3 ubiquitin-protein ligase RGLG
MGNPSSKTKKPKFRAIKNQYESLAEVQEALRKSGLESSICMFLVPCEFKCILLSVIVGVDFTESNETSGEKTFGGRPLHDISAGVFLLW